MKKIFIVFTFFLLVCNICFAQDELAAKSRKARKSDLIGTWQMIYQTVSPLFKDKSDFFADYQVFEFFEDGYVKNIASKKRIERQKISFLLQRMPKSNVYYFTGDGLILMQRNQKDFDNIAISIAEDDFKKPLRSMAPLLKAGDLIVSYLDSKKIMYMQRYLRRLDLNSD